MPDPWIRVHADLADKPVVLRASSALHVSLNEAVGLLVRLWGKMSRLGNDGHVDTLSDFHIESWAGWRGRRGLFARFIREHHTDASGRIREWDDYNGALENRRAGDRERQQRRRERLLSSRVTSDGGHADVTRDVTDDVTRDVTPMSRVTSRVTSHDPPRDERDSSAPARAKRYDNERDTTTNTTTTTSTTTRASAMRLSERLLTAIDRAALGVLLDKVAEPETWIAELTVSLDGMAGHTMATPEQLGQAIRDFLGNGAGEAPNLRRMRRYIEGAVHPAYVSPYRAIVPKAGGGARNDAALDEWAERKEREHGQS